LILERRPHPEQGFRACLGIVRLVRPFGADRHEAAATRAIGIGTLTYGSVAPASWRDRSASAAPARNVASANSTNRGSLGGGRKPKPSGASCTARPRCFQKSRPSSLHLRVARLTTGGRTIPETTLDYHVARKPQLTRAHASHMFRDGRSSPTTNASRSSKAPTWYAANWASPKPISAPPTPGSTSLTSVRAKSTQLSRTRACYASPGSLTSAVADNAIVLPPEP
jgi:hypothetical protein